ncbi:MAG: ATP-binding cassette domain-containing protein, partial [Methylobacter sp.]
MTAVKLKLVDINTTAIQNSPSNDAYLPLVELKNVCKSYGEGKNKTSILKDINLDIKEGEFIAIVGFSGSGKTTLIST